MGEINIHFVTTPTVDTPGTTLLLQTASKHYIFGNESEGTQRACTQFGTRLTRVSEFFATGRSEWHNMGGFIGLLLTLADSATAGYQMALEQYRLKPGKAAPEPQPPNLRVFGPPNFKHLLATCRRYIFRKGLPIIATEVNQGSAARAEDGTIEPTWRDENIQVWAFSTAPLPEPSAHAQDPHAQDKLAAWSDYYDKFLNTFEDHQATGDESEHERKQRFDRIRDVVINHMFDSTWKFDTLVDKHISEVEMPAAMFIRNPDTGKLEPYKGPMPGGTDPLPDIRVLIRTPWPGAMILDLPPTRPAPEAVSYIVRTYPMRGKFDAKRAKELGVKPGPDFGRLSTGNSVTNANGETITSDMVVGPEKPGQGVAILEVPSVDYLKPLLQREELMSENVMNGIRACVWILGPNVSGHPLLEDFMAKLKDVQHVVSSLNDNPNRLSYDSVAAQTFRLSQIDPERYHVPHHDNVSLPQVSLHDQVSRESKTSSKAVVAERGLRFNLMPAFKVIKEHIQPPVDLGAEQQQASQEILDLAKTAQEAIQSDSKALKDWENLLARPNTEVITLGTGSALPSKYRNVSSTLIKVPGIGNYLLDCGEGTLGTLRRLYSHDELVDILRNLRMIWISHLHADHHLGTTSVIKAWYSVVHDRVPASSPPNIPSLASSTSDFGLAVISHNGMLRWLGEYSSIEDFGYSRIVPLEIAPAPPGEKNGSSLRLARQFIPGENLPSGSDHKILSPKDYRAVLGLDDIQACRVSHCHGAMALSLTFPEEESPVSVNAEAREKPKPLKISYSGDCRPSHNFAVIGQDSTVLIHEATFDDELKGDAIAKKHSTTSEALGVGAKMDAKAVVLTHFSQRYQKIPVLETVGNDNDTEAKDDHSTGTKDNIIGAKCGHSAGVEDVTMEDITEEAPAHEGEGEEVMENPDIAVAPTAPRDDVPPNSQSGKREQVIRVHAKDMKVAIAFDYMRIRIGDIAKLEKFNKALEALLMKEDEEKEKPKEKTKEGQEQEHINSNGKKTSPMADGEGKKKKSKRNN